MRQLHVHLVYRLHLLVVVIAVAELVLALVAIFQHRDDAAALLRDVSSHLDALPLGALSHLAVVLARVPDSTL